MDLGERYGLANWLRDGLISGIVLGISSLVLSWLLPSRQPEAGTTPHTPRRWHFLIHLNQTIHAQRAWRVIAILGAGYGLSTGLTNGLIDIGGLSARLGVIVGFGMSAGLSIGIISVLLSLIFTAQTEGISLTERLSWTWRSLTRSLLTPKHVKNALLLGSLFGLSTGLSDGIINSLNVGLGVMVGYGLGYGLSAGLLYWFLLGLFQGVSPEQIEDHARRLPNQGVHRSLHNSLLLGLISSGFISVIGGLSVALSVGLSAGLNIGLSLGLNDGLSVGVSVGVSVGLSTGLSNGLHTAPILAVCGGLLVCASRGGLAVLRHYVIRLLLARSHTFPWHAPRFLEEATARILLRRVGGGYSFPHRLLLDYFADLPEQQP